MGSGIALVALRDWRLGGLNGNSRRLGRCGLGNGVRDNITAYGLTGGNAIGAGSETIFEEDLVILIPNVGGDAVDRNRDELGVAPLAEFDQAPAGCVVVPGLAADVAR